MFRQAGVIQVDTLEEMFDVAQLLAHQPLPRGRRVAIVGNSDALGPARRRRRGRASGWWSTSRSRSAPSATAEDFEDALDAAIDDPEVDAVVAVYIPPLNVSGEDVANVLAAVGEQSDKPLVSTFLGAEGVPELLRVPDVAGSTAGRGSVPSYPARRGGRARAGAGRRVRRLAAHARTARRPTPTPSTPPAAKRLVDRAAARAPRRAPTSTLDELTELLAAYGIELWQTRDGRDAATRRSRGRARSSAGTSCSRPPPSTCASGPTWRTCGATSTTPPRCATPGRPCTSSIAEPGARRLRRAEERAARRAGRDPHASRTRSSGRSSRSASPARSPSCSATASYRIPPLAAARRRRRWSARSRSSPMLFGYRGSEVVDVAEVERLIQRVAQLQNDLPQVRALELSLVLAGADGATVLDRVGPGRAGRRPALGLVRAPAVARRRGHPARLSR